MKKAIVRNSSTKFGIEISFPELIEVPGHGPEAVKREAAKLFFAAIGAAQRTLFEQGAREVEVLYFGNEVSSPSFLPVLHREDFGANGLLTRAHSRAGSGLASVGWEMVALPYPEFNKNGYGEVRGKVATIWLADPWLKPSTGYSLRDVRE